MSKDTPWPWEKDPEMWEACLREVRAAREVREEAEAREEEERRAEHRQKAARVAKAAHHFQNGILLVPYVKDVQRAKDGAVVIMRDGHRYRVTVAEL